MTATVVAARLKPEAETGWTRYVTATERRIASEVALRDRFLALDFAPSAAADRRALLSGEVVVRGVESVDAAGEAIDVPSALVHHWRGAVFVPRATVDGLLAKLQSGELLTQQEDVLKSAILERAPGRLRVYLKLQRSKIVTVVFNTEHVVTFARVSPTRATSQSTATKIAELEEAGTPREHELPVGDDRGFLWKLNAYWRYEQVAGGVIIECESVSLSRTVPSVVRYIVGPLIDSTARESMTRTLEAVRLVLTQ
ncbi:MAG TPA: hypothetical protein VJN96_21365 [Vicinamibacterales bacterium]|nr:hypothetical protein [Vicinamibacterales bacterium]